MYCPRCNLHSEEYVDKCPLCAGPMEVDEFGSGLMKTPTLPEKEKSDDFPKEESLEIPDENFGEETDLSGLEFEQEKIVSEAKKEADEKEEYSEKEEITSSQEEEYLFDQTARLYQQEIPKRPGGKKLSPIFIGSGILLILIFIGLGYFYFSQSGLKSSAPLLPKPEEGLQPLPSEKTGSVQLEKKEETPSLPTQETKAPFTSLKPSKMVPAKQGAKEEAALVPPSPAKSQEKALKTKAPKEISSKGIETSLPTPDPQGQYAILVGSFKIEENALEIKDTLREKGYPVSSYLVELPGKGSWYRVIVGNYANLQETKRVASKLKTEEKVPALIMKGDKYL